MFGGSRRRRPPTAPLTLSTANPNAATAAASAFMSASNQQSNKTLSSAAAAAALRARPHTPTNVAEVQTKRTVRRSASVSSSGSARPGSRLANGHTQLERQGSSASMTERTFRSPSPRRSSTPVAHEPKPPVPQIPDGHRNSTTKPRVPGTGMQNFRTASQKMKSDAPSWHGQPTGDTSNVRTSDAIMRTTKPQSPDPVTTMASPGRPDSRSSVNFSYPTTFRPQSPPASPISPRSSASAPHFHRPPSSSSQRQNSQQLVYDPNSRRMVPKTHIEEPVGLQTKQAEERPPRKRRDSALRREGSQSSKGATAKPKESTVNEDRGLREPQNPERSTKPRLAAVEEVYPVQDEEREAEAEASKTTNLPTRNVPTEPIQPIKPTPQHPSSSASIDSGGHASQSQPSHTAQEHPTAMVQDESRVVNEKPRVHDRQPSPPQTVLNALDAVPTRQALFENPRSPEPDKKPTYESPQPTPTPPIIEKSGVPEMRNEPKVTIAENRPVAALAVENSQLRRSSSNSPARQARFAPGPTENLAVRHAPLPRSASPIKSAMKQTSSIPRESSPSDNASDPQSSSAGPDQKDESTVSRKKSVRVSFNDQGTVIMGDASPAAETESPAAQSPQGGKRTWFSNIGRSKKKEIALEDDEVMKPRPALPSFGSIRDKKARETGERALVRPLEPTYTPAVSSSPELRPQSSSTLNDSEMTEETSLGQSSDHAIGAVLSQDQTSRNAANISRFREPLPPVVTSVEGCGYGSDSFQGSDDEELDSAIESGFPSMPSSALGTQLTEPDTDDGAEIPTTKKDAAPQEAAAQQKYIPEVSITQPSPMLPDERSGTNGSSSAQYFDVPGGFPDNKSDPQSPKGAIFEPDNATIKPNQVEGLPQTTLDTTTPILDPNNSSEEESDGSIYSDAYEDIPDLNSGGFMSLDAIVDRPASQEPKAKLVETKGNSEMPTLNNKFGSDAVVGDSSTNQDQSSPPEDTNDWEQAKAFWRGLTAEKRRQLELEAAEEAGVEGDREEAAPPVRRNSSKKKSSGAAQPAPQKAVVHQKLAQTKPQQQPPLANGQHSQSGSTQSRVSMRKTLRSNEHASSTVQQPSSRQTLRAQAPTPSQPVSSRDQTTKLQQRSSLPASSGAKAAAQPKPSLQRQGSDASDSSFKRSRRPLGGHSTFRTTMRQTSPIQSQRGSTLGSGRFSLRSLSPAGSSTHREANGNFATSSPGGMRRTMRSNSESSHEGKRSSIHFPLFSRTTKSNSKPAKWTSRFDNSSDEDDEAPREFRSRIRTSTDDEDENRPASSREVKPPAKAVLHNSNTTSSLSRPAPVPEVEEDSPDLPDSDDEFMPSLLHTPQRPAATNGFAAGLGGAQPSSGAIGTSTLGRSRSGRGELVSSVVSPALPAKERHGSFLDILRRNKKVDQPGKIQRPELRESAARRDTKLERDLEQLRDLREQLKDLRSERPPSPKLRKRPSVSRNGSGGLPRPTSAGQLLGRSATTDAIGPPSLGDRRSFSHGTDPNNESMEFENASLGSSGQRKKKKFRALRRMFKLDE